MCIHLRRHYRLGKKEKYAKIYRLPRGYQYAVCLKEDGTPIGYVHVSMDSSHDLGYGLRRELGSFGTGG